MEIILPDGRKANAIYQVDERTVILQFDDGREVAFPVDKLPKEKEGEDTLKLVKVSAMERLQELCKDEDLIRLYVPLLDKYTAAKIEKLKTELMDEARTEFKQKWGLT